MTPEQGRHLTHIGETQIANAREFDAVFEELSEADRRTLEEVVGDGFDFLAGQRLVDFVATVKETPGTDCFDEPPAEPIDMGWMAIKHGEIVC